MKLISVKCPNCGSKLEFTPNSKTVTCEYCGYDIMVDDEVKRIKLDNAEQTGYDLGKGLHRALQEAGEEVTKIRQSLQRTRKDSYSSWNC